MDRLRDARTPSTTRAARESRSAHSATPMWRSSSPSRMSAVMNILACIAAKIPVVVGTTGWYDSLPMITEEANAAGSAVLWAPNFAVGVNLFVELTRRAGEIMAAAPDFSAAVVETHHAAKKDAPSGTAIAIVKAMEKGLKKDVPVTSVRTGSVPGTHEVIFDSTYRADDSAPRSARQKSFRRWRATCGSMADRKAGSLYHA